MNTCLRPETETAEPRSTAQLSPLHQVAEGRSVRIRELAAAPEVTCRLREIGLCEGQIIRLIARHTNIICQVCNARLALNTALAQTILVESLME